MIIRVMNTDLIAVWKAIGAKQGLFMEADYAHSKLHVTENEYAKVSQFVVRICDETTEPYIVKTVCTPQHTS